MIHNDAIMVIQCVNLMDIAAVQCRLSKELISFV